MKARRDAFTLIELLTVLTVMSAIFGVMIVTLHAMQKASQGFADGIAAEVQQQRFAVQWRSDVHQASSVELPRADADKPAATILELTLTDGQIVQYTLMPEGVERLVRAEGAVEYRESFAVQPVLEQGWTLDDTRASPLLTVFLAQPTGGGPAASGTLYPLRLDAVLRAIVSSDASARGSATL